MANLTDTIKYLDFTGLSKYDALIKEVIAAGDAAVEKKLNDAIGEGGDVATQISTAIDNLKGTLDAGDSATLAAINDELDGLDQEIATLKGDDTTAGSVARAIKDKVETLNYTIAAANHVDGRPVVGVTETNGVIDVTEGTIKAEYVTTSWGETDPVSSTANVQAALLEIYGKIADNAEAGELAVYKGETKVNKIEADGSTYTFKQGETTVATINIAKDMVVSGGDVIIATGSEKKNATESAGLTAGARYIQLNLANSDDILYIPVDGLFKDHEGSTGTKVTVNVAYDAEKKVNVISAGIVAGSIEKSDLTASLQNEISAAATVVNAKSTGHVQVAVTAADGANPASVTVTENDIASADDLSDEVTRAKADVNEVAGLVGITGAEEARTYTTNVTLDEGVSHTVVNDINKLHARLVAVETFISNLTPISENEIKSLFTVSSGD